MLEEFLNHKLIINTNGATIEDLKELDRIINIPYRSKDRIYERYTDTGTNRFIHHDVNDSGLSISYTAGCIPVVTYDEFICNQTKINISPEEFDKIFET